MINTAKTKTSSAQILLEDNALALQLLGRGGEHINYLEDKLGVVINTRGNKVNIEGVEDKVRFTEELIIQLYELLESGYPLKGRDFNHAVNLLLDRPNKKLSDVFMSDVSIKFRNVVIAPKSATQKIYLESIKKNDIVFGIGPAGTGKTYLAMAMAVSALQNKAVDRIILVRPAVEAGENLGFLPGDLAAKVDPYLRPLYDALHDMMDLERAQKLIEKGIIEVAPLAFMRGRTLSNSYVILDEAQNATIDQMKMFLTRLGFDSKALITGDITQIDLPSAKPSGLVEARSILKGIKGIDFITFSEVDVVRHPLVQKIIKAFDEVKG